MHCVPSSIHISLLTQIFAVWAVECVVRSNLGWGVGLEEIPIHEHCVVETENMKHRPVHSTGMTVITASGLQGHQDAKRRNLTCALQL